MRGEKEGSRKWGDGVEICQRWRIWYLFIYFFFNLSVSVCSTDDVNDGK